MSLYGESCITTSTLDMQDPKTNTIFKVNGQRIKLYYRRKSYRIKMS